MAQETLKELKYDGKKVIAEVARRDALGRIIDATYKTESQINTLISTALNGYATQTWVQQQGYLTQHQDISGKLDVSTFNSWTGTTAPATYVAINGFKANYLDANNVAYKTEIPSLSGYVPTSRKVNGKALTSDITLAKADVELGSVVNAGQTDNWGGTNDYFTAQGALNLYNELNNHKQNKLTAGANISISGDTISCTYSYTNPVTGIDVTINLQ